MPKYRVDVPVTMTYTVIVEAESETEAIEAVEVPGLLCAQCSGWGRKHSLDPSDPDFNNAEAELVEDPS